MSYKKIIMCLLITGYAGTLSASSEIIRTRTTLSGGKSIEIQFTPGEHWNHRLAVIPWLPFFKIKTVPQIAVWVEDITGQYIDTLYVTEKTARQGWASAPGDSKKDIRRKSSLPVWAHARGVTYLDGLYMPTKSEPLPDTITAASPKSAFSLHTKLEKKPGIVVIKAEVNNSCDFNEYYASDVPEGSPAYSGGEWGSGQPALIYEAKIDLSESNRPVQMRLVGHSNPDGDDGKIYDDLSNITTAAGIMKRITVVVKQR